MTSIKALLTLDKNTGKLLRIEMKRNLFYLLFTPAFLCVISFLISVGYSALSNYEFEVSRYVDLSAIGVLICCFFGAFGMLMSAIAAFTNFRFLYNRRKVDFFQALPVCRSTQFVCAGIPHLISLIIGFVLSFLTAPVAIGLMVPKGITVQFDMGVFFLSLLVTLLGVIVSFFLFELLAVSAGKAWHYILLALLSSTAQFGLAKCFCLPSLNIAGLGMKSASLASAFVPSYAINFSPTEFGVGFTPVLLGLLLCVVVFFLLGIWQYNKRDNECAAFRVNGKLAVAIITGGVALNTFFFLDKPSQFGLNILIGMSASLIIFVLSGLIFYKKAFQKLFVIEYGCMCTCMVVLLCVCGTNGFGWSDRLPAVENIASVTVTNQYTESPSNALIEGFGDFFETYDGYDEEDEKERITLKETESIEKILKIHRLTNAEHRNHDAQDNGNTIRFEYTLKNGKTVSRPVYYPYYEEEGITYFERVCATKEARKLKLAKYDVKKYLTVAAFSNFLEAHESKPIFNDPAQLKQIYEEYLDLSYEEALQAYSNDVDNIDLFVYFYQNKGASGSLKQRYERNEEAAGITLHFPYSDDMIREKYMQAFDFSGTAALADVNEQSVSFLYYGELTEDYSGLDLLGTFDISVAKTMCLHYGGGYLPENIFGKIPLNSNVYLEAGVDMHDPSHSKKDLQTLLSSIKNPAPKELKNINGSYGYAVCFILKDRRVTPMYYVRSIPSSLQAVYDDEIYE